MPRMMSCLATLSQLAPDNNFKTFSSIVLWVLVYQFLIQVINYIILIPRICIIFKVFVLDSVASKSELFVSFADF